MRSVTRAVLVLAAFIVMGRFTAEAQKAPDYLSQAERILSAISQESLKKDVRKPMSELRKHFADLVTAYRTNGDPHVPPAANPTPDLKSDAEHAPMNWKEEFSAVERVLGGLLGGVPAAPPADVRGQLEQFRLELELFFVSALDVTSETRKPAPAG